MLLHSFILLNFLLQIGYSAYMVFFVFRPHGISGPLWEAAKSVPFETMVVRRLYAIEFWISFTGLAIYLALTEFSSLFQKFQKTKSEKK
ncbi:MAG: hypothetical protein D6805_10385 [Planctomycetota bacterium]|nr:MAG: hypothetical protein D6805_10385 [Planctomycetota bacterium]